LLIYARVNNTGSGDWSLLRTMNVSILSDMGGHGGAPHFGHALALSGDGLVIAAGAPVHSLNAAGHQNGAVYVLYASSSGWAQGATPLQTVLPAQLLLGESDGEEIGASCGWSVALARDGRTLAVGCPGYQSSRGSARVFVRPLGLSNGATEWEPVTLLLAPTIVSSAQFGYSISLAHEGDLVAVGAPFDFTGNADGLTGAVYSWVASNGVWAQLGTLDPSVFNPSVVTGALCGNNSEFGSSVAVQYYSSSSGAFLAVGAPGDAPDGSVWMFSGQNFPPAYTPQYQWVYSSDALTQPAGLSSSHPGGARFGQAVAIDDEGSFISSMLGQCARSSGMQSMRTHDINCECAAAHVCVCVCVCVCACRCVWCVVVCACFSGCSVRRSDWRDICLLEGYGFEYELGAARAEGPADRRDGGHAEAGSSRGHGRRSVGHCHRRSATRGTATTAVAKMILVQMPAETSHLPRLFHALLLLCGAGVSPF